MRESIRVAGAYIGLIVGAGFASGQEILQFFTSFGIPGMIGIVIATILFAFLGMQVTKMGSELQTRSHKEVINKICGRYIGFAIDYFITFFLFGVAVVMIAGSGSTLHQQFGISPLAGSLLMTIITIGTLCLNVKKVISIISIITPFLLVLVFIITGYSIITSDTGFTDLNKIAHNQPSAAPHWIVGALLYVSYNIAAGIAMLSVIGGTVKNSKQAGFGGLLGGIGIGLLILLINIGMFLNLDRLQGAEMPTLMIASEISPIVGVFMSVAILGMIFNTTVGMLYAFTARFVEPETNKFKGSVIIFTLLAFGASFVGFIKLVGTVYPITGYLGFGLILAIFISWFMMRAKQEVPAISNPSIRN